MSATSEYSSLLGTDRLIDPILRSSTVSLSASSDGNTPYRVYTRRWFMLTVVCVLNISNAMIWMTFGPIADRAGEYFKISYNEVNWLSLIFMTASIPLGICASWLLDTMGLRASIVLGSWLNAIGCGVRVISTLSFVPQQARFPVLISGQFLAACSQPFVMFSPTKLAATWFQGDQRATANMIASVSNPVGILLANILSPLLAPNQHDVPFALYIYCVPAALAMLMATFGFCNSVPPTPPSASAADPHEPFFQGLKKIIHNKPYLILALCFGCGIALFSSLSTLFEQILCPQGYKDQMIGIYGALLIGTGVLGAAVAGAIVDKTKKFMETAKVCFAFAALASIFLSVISQQPDEIILTGVAAGIMGFFAFSLIPVCFELGVECTYPVSEGTSAGFIYISGQIQGIILVIVMQALGRPLSARQNATQDCDLSTADTIEPKDMTISVLVFSGIASLAACIFIIFFDTPYKRHKAEECEAAERILNFSINSKQREQRQYLSA